MKELPCLKDKGVLSLQLIKANSCWKVLKKEQFKKVGCSTCNGITTLRFRSDISAHYSELVIQEHETAVLNMACLIDDNSASLSEDDVICPEGERHNSLSKKVAKVINCLDKLIENSQLSTFSSWRPFSNTIRLYINAEGYTHITYYQTTRGDLKPLVSAVYSEAHVLTFTSHINSEKPIDKSKVKKLEVVAIIDKAPVADHRENNRRETSNDSGWIKRYKPRYLEFTTEALPPKFKAVIAPDPVMTEDEYDVIPETPPALMGLNRSHSPSPNSFSLHLSQGTLPNTPYSPPQTFEEAIVGFHKSSTPDTQRDLPTPDTQRDLPTPDGQDVNDFISELLDTASNSSEDSSQQTSINISSYSSSSSTPPNRVQNLALPTLNQSHRRVRRKPSAYGYSENSPRRETLHSLELNQQSSQSQPEEDHQSKPTPDGLENESSSESFQAHQPSL
ncbi:hypothetical protein [Parendozoicomonas sp. Alg238-R29]|uniref:hypothetical protein n=1 Tax=Parendozoicomonas sp. Alg238-R29 TaxID=2993446 RepID=UPI00248D8A83|nr:hypothetical protein [Parendozoicomonas sp. Alg238-R29]